MKKKVVMFRIIFLNVLCFSKLKLSLEFDWYLLSFHLKYFQTFASNYKSSNFIYFQIWHRIAFLNAIFTAFCILNICKLRVGIRVNFIAKHLVKVYLENKNEIHGSHIINIWAGKICEYALRRKEQPWNILEKTSGSKCLCQSIYQLKWTRTHLRLYWN